MTAFDEIGSEKLRQVVTDFYERVLDDVMIGFFFRNADKNRLIDKEWELAARMLGKKDIKYTGQSIRSAHAAHPIMGGHFNRRLQILKETMDAHALSPLVKDTWIEHTEALRSLITTDGRNECTPQTRRLPIVDEVEPDSEN